MDIHALDLARYPDRGTPLRISLDGGWEPMWGPDGALYHRSLDGDRVFRVRVGAGWPPAVEAPELLLEEDFSPGRPYGRLFDIGPDGTMYLRKSSTSSVSGSTVRVVLKWVQQLGDVSGTPVARGRACPRAGCRLDLSRVEPHG